MAYAIYRLPHEDHATIIRQTNGNPVELHSLTELNGIEGFVVAPFEVAPNQPVVVIQGEMCNVECGKTRGMCNVECGMRFVGRGKTAEEVSSFNIPHSTFHNYYSIDFANYHAQLENDHFRKIVLARCADEKTPEDLEPMELFYRACEMYPRLFIALVDTPQTGCWLTATPEILLDGKGNDWRTIALAGTMKLEGDQLNGEGETLRWSTKNIQEQRIVATYIAECLEQFTGNFREEGPRTVRAANLVHLRSDFTFKLDDNNHIGIFIINISFNSV